MTRIIARSIEISFLLWWFVVSTLWRWSSMRARGVELTLRQVAVGDAIVRLCRYLGATFVKGAQVLATRADLVPEPTRERLSALHDQVGPFPYRLVRETIVEQLEAPPEALFSQFDPYPVASASVAQVHRACLPDGREVAVKVLRPDVEAVVATDFKVLRFWARFLVWLPPIRLLSPMQVLDELEHALSRQLDLRIEADNNARFQENFCEQESIRFPQVVRSLSSRRVLCMDYVEGASIVSCVPKEDSDEDAKARALTLAKTGYRMVLTMVFDHGFVHADLHPGNLRVVERDKLVVFDLGLVASLTPDQRNTLKRLCFAWVARDARAVANGIGELVFHGQPPRDPERLREAIEEMMARYGDIVLAEIQVGRLLLDLLLLVRRQWPRFDPAFTMVALAIAVVEGVARQLAPELRLMQEAMSILSPQAATLSPQQA
jgi:ubiquinone biosynthesis protein